MDNSIISWSLVQKKKKINHFDSNFKNLCFKFQEFMCFTLLLIIFLQQHAELCFPSYLPHLCSTIRRLSNIKAEKHLDRKLSSHVGRCNDSQETTEHWALRSVSADVMETCPRRYMPSHTALMYANALRRWFCQVWVEQTRALIATWISDLMK